VSVWVSRAQLKVMAGPFFRGVVDVRLEMVVGVARGRVSAVGPTDKRDKAR
jgi:hypothetical protein